MPDTFNLGTSIEPSLADFLDAWGGSVYSKITLRFHDDGEEWDRRFQKREGQWREVKSFIEEGEA